MDVTLSHKETMSSGIICPSSSKSESNRILIIHALSGSNFDIDNLSDAEDTKVLTTILRAVERTDNGVLDVGLAGTAMRFLTAYLSIQEGKTFELTGEERMKQRPVKILVDALRDLGADIRYLQNEGYPPLKIRGKKLSGKELVLSGSVSSQYISALLMIAPMFSDGVKIRFKGEIISRPYITMTINLMQYFGVKAMWDEDTIVVQQGIYQPNEISVESDWSAASYYYGIVALADNLSVELKGLNKESRQADAVVQKIYQQFGVITSYGGDGITLTKTGENQFVKEIFEYDFINCPDIAQTVAVTCAALNIKAKLTGLKSLRIKETDRIAALQMELTNLGFHVEVDDDDLLIHPVKAINPNKKQWAVNTYNDHRMAMAFAPLALLQQITIKNAEVVKKSYPGFWKDLNELGFYF